MPSIRERLGCAIKSSNREDLFAVAMKRGTETFGHVLRTILCDCTLYMFASSKNNSLGTKELASCPITNYRHFSYA